MRTLFCLSTALMLACTGKTTASATGDTSDTGPPTQTTPDPTGDTGEPQGACGDPVLYDMTVIGIVEGPGGVPSEGAHVALEDRAWTVGDILGEGFTDENGVFTIAITDLTSLEDCWGLLGYYIIADKGVFYGERGINTNLFNAIYDGTLTADISAFPIEIEEISR